MGQDKDPPKKEPSDANEISEEELESVNGGTSVVRDKMKSASKNADAVRDLL